MRKADANYVPAIGDYVMVNTDVLCKTTSGTSRNAYAHIMEVCDGERVWKVMGTATEKATGEVFYVLGGARFPYKASELILIGHAEEDDNKE